MMKAMAKTLLTLLLSILIALVTAFVGEKDTNLHANGAFSDFMTVKTSYYRSLCDANPLLWDQDLANKAAVEIRNCDLQYDYWSSEGQIIFRMVSENDQIVNSPNATYFSVDHWYDMRENYADIQSDEYDELQPFYPAWEFTQMVWKANNKIGCAYAADVVCPSLDPIHDNMYQLYCLLTPGGNKWDQWGANVECSDCVGVKPQTSTVNTATITFSEVKRAIPRTVAKSTTTYEPPNETVKASLAAAVHRVEKYLTMNDDEFMSRWDMPEAVSTASTTSYSSG